jgi:hypothetical protein
MNSIEIHFGWEKHAGLICICWGNESKRQGYNLHLFVQPEHWHFGRSIDWYDGPLYSFGFGFLFLFAWN